MKPLLFTLFASTLWAQGTVNTAQTFIAPPLIPSLASNGTLGTDSTGKIIAGTGGGTNFFTSLYSGFTPITNPEPTITGAVGYANWQTGTCSSLTSTCRGANGLGTFTEPVSMNRTIVYLTTAFQASSGITALQLSIGTATNATAYMLPVQVGYTITAGVCAANVITWTVGSPVLNQAGTVAVSGVTSSAGNWNQSSTATWLNSTSFTQAATCSGTYTSGGMAGLQGMIAGNVGGVQGLPQAASGSDTAYLWITETNSSPGAFSLLTAGSVYVWLGGVQGVL